MDESIVEAARARRVELAASAHIDTDAPAQRERGAH